MHFAAMQLRGSPRARQSVALVVAAWIVAYAADLRAQAPTPLSEIDYVLPASTLQTALEADGAEAQVSALSTEELVQRLLAAEQRIEALEGENAARVDPVPRLPEAPEVELLDKAKPEDEEEKWYDKFSLRGYVQMRLNGVYDYGPGSAPAQVVGDSSVGDDENFLIRRARLVFSGDMSEHLGIYIQPDFATTPPGGSDQILFGQVRDWYGDIYLTTDKVHRIRAGQSKIPYGWENLQSSGNRIPLDRNDGLNSAARNERDMGVFYYWTPEEDQKIFSWVNESGLRGSGNYGTFGIGVINGQGGSLREENENLHVLARLSVPFFINECQLVEVGVQGYAGKYVVSGSPISPLGVGPPVDPANTDNGIGQRDERIAWTLVYYAQPIGFQTEWNVGRGPALNEAQTAIEERSLTGGYGMLFYRLQTASYGEFWPFVRYNYFRGGYKTQNNAPYSFVDEVEGGVEWVINDNVDLTVGLTHTDRTNTSAEDADDTLSYGQFVGDYARCQLQINY
jgi:hypothetical protein